MSMLWDSLTESVLPIFYTPETWVEIGPVEGYYSLGLRWGGKNTLLEISDLPHYPSMVLARSTGENWAAYSLFNPRDVDSLMDMVTVACNRMYDTGEV